MLGSPENWRTHRWNQTCKMPTIRHGYWQREIWMISMTSHNVKNRMRQNLILQVGGQKWKQFLHVHSQGERCVAGGGWWEKWCFRRAGVVAGTTSPDPNFLAPAVQVGRRAPNQTTSQHMAGMIVHGILPATNTWNKSHASSSWGIPNPCKIRR